MSVGASDIKYYLTPNAEIHPLDSLGGVGYGNEVSAAIDGIFQDVSPAEAAAGKISYRAIDIRNVNVTDTLYGAVVWISTETSSTSSTVALAYDSTGTQSIANETSAPSGPALTFTTPTTQATGIALGDIAPGVHKRIWLRRTVSASAAMTASDAGALSTGGGTAS
jgi:hypothetical protein